MKTDLTVMLFFIGLLSILGYLATAVTDIKPARACIPYETTTYKF